MINLTSFFPFYEVFLRIDIFFFFPFLFVTLILGTIKGLIQTNLKRIFAFSSFVHLSFLMLSFFFLPFVMTQNISFVSKNLDYFLFNEKLLAHLPIYDKLKIAAYSITILYLFVYVLLNFLFFSFLLLFKKVSYNLEQKELKSISDLSNLDSTNNLFSYFVVSICLSLIGLPPFAGFFAKYLILYQFFISEYRLIAIFFLFFSLISSFFYFKIIKIVYFTKKKKC